MARSSHHPRDRDRDAPPEKPAADQADGSTKAGAEADAVFSILHIDDDPNDKELLLAATLEAAVPFRIHNVVDAGQAMALLNGEGSYADRARFPLPSLILLDLKMPRSTGIEILMWMRTVPELKGIPVVVLSGSARDEDLRQAYASGANAYLVKPLGFGGLVEMVRNLNRGWFVPSQNVLARINRQFVAR